MTARCMFSWVSDIILLGGIVPSPCDSVCCAGRGEAFVCCHYNCCMPTARCVGRCQYCKSFAVAIAVQCLSSQRLVAHSSFTPRSRCS